MASTYITKTPSSTTNQKTWTVSCWVKRAKLTSTQMIWGVNGDSSGNYFTELNFNSGDQLEFRQGGTVGDPYQTQMLTNARYRDTFGYYHIVVACDTTQSTEANRVKIYVNGEQITSFAIANYPSLNENFRWHYTGYAHSIGRSGQDNARYFDGIISHFHNIDGTQYAASDFGETDATTGEWKIKTSPSVTYGSFGTFILKDGNSVTDQSGQSNNWSVGGGTLTKTEDCPSNVFCTANPLSSGNSEAFNGNTNIFFDDTGQWRAMYSTLGASSGKYYMEAKVDAVGGEASIGVIPADLASKNQDTGDYLGKETDSIGYLNNGRLFKSNNTLQTGLASMSSGTIVGISLDLDNNTVQFYNNDSAVGNAIALNADTTYLFGFSGYSDTRFYANFGNGYFHTTAVSSAGTNASGNGIFEYDVKPSDATALSTKGLNL
tara:strand:+ start:227 stop:1528 length:1302 start_codon:yes stop_codon:yes gene_type:complete